jgi:hypothetical protein
LGIFYAFLQSKIQNLKSKICGLAALSICPTAATGTVPRITAAVFCPAKGGIDSGLSSEQKQYFINRETHSLSLIFPNDVKNLDGSSSQSKIENWYAAEIIYWRLQSHSRRASIAGNLFRFGDCLTWIEFDHTMRN